MEGFTPQKRRLTPTGEGCGGLLVAPASCMGSSEAAVQEKPKVIQAFFPDLRDEVG